MAGCYTLFCEAPVGLGVMHEKLEIGRTSGHHASPGQLSEQLRNNGFVVLLSPLDLREPSIGTKADYSAEYTRIMRARLRVYLSFTYQHSSWLFY